MTGSLELSLINSFPGVVAACLVYFAINTGGVATIIALCTHQRPAEVWRQSFLWTAPSYFAGAGISALALFIFGSRLGIAFVFVSPVAYLIYHSYATYTARAEEKQQHIDDLQDSQAHLADLYLATIKSLALAIDAKDQYTSQHILRVQRYAVATGKRLGLTGDELEGLNTGALLHDIGKLGVPESVLLKPGRLTDEEFAKVKKHPQIGAAILGPVDFPWPVLPVVRSHHERWDGTGYPDGLKGEDIPLDCAHPGGRRRLRCPHVHPVVPHGLDARAGDRDDHAGCRHVIWTRSVVAAFLEVIDDVVAELAQESQAQGESPLGWRPGHHDPGQTGRPGHLPRVLGIVGAVRGRADALVVARPSRNTGDPWPQDGSDPAGHHLPVPAQGRGRRHDGRADGGRGQLASSSAEARTLNAASQSLAVAARRETYMGEYDVDDLLPAGSAVAFWELLRSALIVPIVHQGEVLGTINVYHAQPDAFSVHDRHLLETIAERAAMALYNGILFDRTRSRASTDPLTGLFNVRYLTEHVENHCRAARRSGGAVRAAVSGLGLVQADQRQLRPPEGRPGPARPERTVPGTRPRDGRRGALRRGRVPDRAAWGRPGGGGSDGAAASGDRPRLRPRPVP